MPLTEEGKDNLAKIIIFVLAVLFTWLSFKVSWWFLIGAIPTVGIWIYNSKE